MCLVLAYVSTHLTPKAMAYAVHPAPQIRLSVYITIVIISLIPNSEEYKELLGSLRTNAGLNGLALLITAMEQTFKDSITLYHAIIILHMLGFLGFGELPSQNPRTQKHYN